MSSPLRIDAINLRDFIVQDFPRIHSELVPQTAQGSFVVRIELRGEGTFKLEVSGSKLTVSTQFVPRPDAWVSLDAAAADAFFSAFLKSGKVLSTPPVLLTDPRLLKNLCMASAHLSFELRDFREAPDAPPRKFTAEAAVGTAAAKKVAGDAADVTVRAGERTLLALASAKMAPEDALSDGDVELTGKKFVAMQLALAFAPFFKKP
ncbi:MAG: SCP2 sterol-binding domain-containing protein [Polyangiaceae bacterium]